MPRKSADRGQVGARPAQEARRRPVTRAAERERKIYRTPEIVFLRLALAQGPLKRRGKLWYCGKRKFSPRAVNQAIAEGNAIILGDWMMTPPAGQAANWPLDGARP